MRLDVTLWRALPVRGPGRMVVSNLQRRARGGAVVATGPHGIRLLVDPQSPPEVSIYLWGTYEPEVVSALERVLAPGCTAVDVGANCGVLSVLMRRLTGTSGRVIAIDPSPTACRRIGEQTAINGMLDVIVVQAGLGAASCRAAYRAGRVGIGMLPSVDAQFTTGDTLEVAVLTLDDVIADADELPPVGLMKIDTDGSELDVLDGARAVLGRDRPVLVFEVFADGMRRRGAEPAALSALLEELEYDLFVAVPSRAQSWKVAPPRIHGFTRAPLTALADGSIDEQNVVAISGRDDGRRARAALLSDDDHSAAR